MHSDLTLILSSSFLCESLRYPHQLSVTALTVQEKVSVKPSGLDLTFVAAQLRLGLVILTLNLGSDYTEISPIRISVRSAI